MKSLLSRLLTIVLLSAIGQAHAADVGRVLLAAGDTVAVRDKQIIKLVFGSTIQDKDLLRTGPVSNLQVRFVDESILSMRESSEIRIDEFRFTGKEDGSERAFFSLLKGGLRKITGLVGRTNNKNYQMSSVVATIGIRGTDYAATLCQQDCRNPDGALAKDGLYGRVIGASFGTNRSSVTNETGEHLFGISQNYHVPDAKTVPQLLLEPPGFVSVAVKSKSTKPPAGTGEEQAAAGGAEQDPRGTTPPAPPPEFLQFVVTEQRDASGNPAVLPLATGFAVAYVFGSGSGSRLVGFDEDVAGTFNSLNQLTGYGIPGTPFSGSLGSGSIVDSGGFTSADGTVITWGRWVGNFSVTNDAGTTFTALPSGHLFGTANVPNIDRPFPGGVATYTFRGGPPAVDFAGNRGTITSSSATIDFTNLSMMMGIGIDFSSVGTFGSANFNLSGSGSANFFSGGDFSGALSGSCSGGGCASASISNGQFDAGLTGQTTGIEILAIGGGFTGTQQGDVVFLSAYENTGFTPGPPAPPAQALAVAYSDSAAGIFNFSDLSQPGSPMAFAGGAPGGNLTSFGSPGTFPSGTLTGAVNDTDLNSATYVAGKTAADAAASGNLHWGRWDASNVVGENPPGTNVPVTNPAGFVHYAYGDHTNMLPSSGTFAYSVIGGPKPAFANGSGLGAITGGALSVTYGAVSGSFSVLNPITIAMSAGQNFALNTCTGGCNFGTTTPHINGASLTGTCTGACSPGASANMSGHFTGPTGEGLAVAGHVFWTGSPVTFAAGLKRCPGPTAC